MRNISTSSFSSQSSSMYSLPSSSTSRSRTSSSPQEIYQLIINTHFKESFDLKTSTLRISQKRKESPCSEISSVKKRLFLNEASEDPDTKDKAFVDKDIVWDSNTKSSSGFSPSSPKYKAASINQKQKHDKYHKLRKNMDKVNKKCFQIYKTISYFNSYPKNKAVFDDCMDNIKNQHKKLDEILELIHK